MCVIIPHTHVDKHFDILKKAHIDCSPLHSTVSHSFFCRDVCV